MSGGGQDWCLWVGKARWLSPLAQVGGRSRVLVLDLPISMGSWPANVRHGTLAQCAITFSRCGAAVTWRSAEGPALVASACSDGLRLPRTDPASVHPCPPQLATSLVFNFVGLVIEGKRGRQSMCTCTLLPRGAATSAQQQPAHTLPAGRMLAARPSPSDGVCGRKQDSITLPPVLLAGKYHFFEWSQSFASSIKRLVLYFIPFFLFGGSR